MDRVRLRGSTLGGVRSRKIASTEEYISRLLGGQPPLLIERRLTPEERLEEALFTGLRLAGGMTSRPWAPIRHRRVGPFRDGPGAVRGRGAADAGGPAAAPDAGRDAAGQRNHGGFRLNASDPCGRLCVFATLVLRRRLNASPLRDFDGALALALLPAAALRSAAPARAATGAPAARPARRRRVSRLCSRSRCRRPPLSPVKPDRRFKCSRSDAAGSRPVSPRPPTPRLSSRLPG